MHATTTRIIVLPRLVAVAPPSSVVRTMLRGWRVPLSPWKFTQQHARRYCFHKQIKNRSTTGTNKTIVATWYYDISLRYNHDNNNTLCKKIYPNTRVYNERCRKSRRRLHHKYKERAEYL